MGNSINITNLQPVNNITKKNYSSINITNLQPVNNIKKKGPVDSVGVELTAVDTQPLVAVTALLVEISDVTNEGEKDQK